MEIGFDVLIKYVFFIESKFMRYQNKLVLMFMFNKHSKLPLSFMESVCCCMNAQRVDVCVCVLTTVLASKIFANTVI